MEVETHKQQMSVYAAREKVVSDMCRERGFEPEDAYKNGFTISTIRNYDGSDMVVLAEIVERRGLPCIVPPFI